MDVSFGGRSNWFCKRSRLSPLSRYAIEARRRGWLFGYAGYDAAAVRAAARTAGALLR